MTTPNEACPGGVRSAAAVTEELRQGSGSGSAPPPPPPPAAGNVDQRVIRDQIRAQQRQLRDARLNATKSKLVRVNRRYYAYAGALAALAVGAIGCRSYAQDQRDTAMALATLAAGAQQQTAPTTPAPVSVDGVPNPLEQLPLTNQAKWMIGAGGDGVLPPKRSTTVVVQMLGQLDMCNVYVGLSDKAEILVAFEPTPAFVPLVTGCDQTAQPVTTTTVTAPPVTAAAAG